MIETFLFHSALFIDDPVSLPITSRVSSGQRGLKEEFLLSIINGSLGKAVNIGRHKLSYEECIFGNFEEGMLHNECKICEN